MKKIPLTRGKFAIVDDEDFDSLNRFKWYCSDTGYAQRDGQMKDGIRGNRIHMHRAILKVKSKVWVDHKNRKTLDNRKQNLRLCKIGKNQWNLKIHKDNQSGFKGVSRVKYGWRALIAKHRKDYYLGTFKTPKLAAAAYDKAARKLHGSFARTNSMR